MADRSALARPQLDPTPIFELYRGSYGSELLTAAVAHFRVFERLVADPMLPIELRGELNLAERSFIVLTTALRAMQLLAMDETGRFVPTPMAREHLCPDAPFDVSGYLGLSADSPGVQDMIERLETNLPRGHKPEEGGVGFIFRENLPSAMEAEASARHFTMALAGRAQNVAPVLAANVPLEGANVLLDVGGGTGIYTFALLQRNPGLRAIVLDRPEVLKIAGELAIKYGVSDRVEFYEGDMFVAPLPSNVDVVLLSNVLHDWDVTECQSLVVRCARALNPGGRLLVHDVFLNDQLDGPLAIALYSAALFTVTEGRAYSGAEYRGWLETAGLNPQPIVPTLIHCGVLAGVK